MPGGATYIRWYTEYGTNIFIKRLCILELHGAIQMVLLTYLRCKQGTRYSSKSIITEQLMRYVQHLLAFETLLSLLSIQHWAT